MQKVERWRVEELSLLLGFIASLLELGRDPEWAGVFSHYDLESRVILAAETVNDESLRRLTRNIRECYAASGTFVHLVLEERTAANTADMAVLNLEFARTRAQLWQTLEEIEARMNERVN